MLCGSEVAEANLTGSLRLAEGHQHAHVRTCDVRPDLMRARGPLRERGLEVAQGARQVTPDAVAFAERIAYDALPAGVTLREPPQLVQRVLQVREVVAVSMRDR